MTAFQAAITFAGFMAVIGVGVFWWMLNELGLLVSK